ncbi:MAG: hypothetical protein QOD50_415 [Actinomycetota bacterium]|jgi:hypothetical protein|nr:hypothetical protein [Actinomycetota bacterium]
MKFITRRRTTTVAVLTAVAVTGAVSLSGVTAAQADPLSPNTGARVTTCGTPTAGTDTEICKPTSRRPAKPVDIPIATAAR